MQLLGEGANPNLVQCPMPAMILAIISEDEDLVIALTKHGIDVNQVYPQVRKRVPCLARFTFPVRVLDVV